jgi:hypothetical protein
MAIYRDSFHAAKPVSPVIWVGALCAALSSVGCEAKAPPAEKAEVAAQPSAAPPPPIPDPAPAATPEKPSRGDVDTELNDARRSAIEEAVTDAKGFLVASEIEEELKKNKAIKEKEAAVKAFDRKAKGKWVLFAGPMVNLTDSGFDLAVTYTPRLSNDPMGMSRQFFTVTFSDIDGYKKDDFKAGDKVVVLAQYQGQAAANEGQELVAKEIWK